VGTVYPERWTASKMLVWYRKRFDTVEIDNSFCFAVNGHRFLTHMKKLKDPATTRRDTPYKTPLG